MGDDSHKAAAGLEADERIHGTVECLGIEGTETFIHEDRIKVQSSGVRLEHIRQPQGEGEGGKEALTARKRRHGPGLSCEGIEDLQIEALLLARVMDALTAVERIPAPADFFQPQVGCDQYIIEDGLSFSRDVRAVSCFLSRAIRSCRAPAVEAISL